MQFKNGILSRDVGSYFLFLENRQYQAVFIIFGKLPGEQSNAAITLKLNRFSLK